jgi:Fungal specific transcription factor domain/Fungal Zn(2)-Cys(6) binuclear cluster domain
MSTSKNASPRLRSRTGCLTCRDRRKKCDEIRPVCTGCRRNFLKCVWRPAHTERAVLNHSTPSVFADAAVSPSTSDWHYAIPDVPLHIDETADLQTVLRRLKALSFDTLLFDPSCLLLVTESKSSVFLFCHYLDSTGGAMSVVKDSSNPLIRQLVPLSLHSTLVMQAILMISAIHISESRPGWTALAWRYYEQVSDAIEVANRSDLQEQLVVCLLLAMFQPIGGGQHSHFARYLRRAESLLKTAREENTVLQTKSFVHDAYFYNAIVDYISWPRPGASGWPGIDVCPSQLCSIDMTGNPPGWLCGVSYQIMEYIWFVGALFRRLEFERSQLGQTSDESSSEHQRLDNLLHSWCPSSEVLANSSQYCRVAELYRCAGIVYLHRIMHPFTNCATDETIQTALSDFFRLLGSTRQASEAPGVLCWAAIFVGACVTKDGHRAELMRFLHSVYDVSKMVNMGHTIRVLAKLWWIRGHEDETELRRKQSRCSWDFYYMWRALNEWNTLIS